MKKFSLLLALALLSAGASAQFLVPVGQGTVVNTTSSYPAPYGQFYWGAKHQFIYLASELTAVEGANGALIARARIAVLQGTGRD